MAKRWWQFQEQLLKKSNLFKNITIKPYSETRFPVNPGFIAESLLFYENVNLQIHNHLLYDLINPIGVDQLIHLIENRNLKVSLWGNVLANIKQTQQACLVQIPADVEKLIYLGLENRTKRKGYSKRVAARLAHHFSSYSLDTNITSVIDEDMRNTEYMKELISVSLKKINEKIIIDPKNLYYEYIITPNGNEIRTNIDFEKINKTFDRKLDVFSILSWASNVREDIQISIDNDSELATDDFVSAQLKVKFNDLMTKFNRNSDHLFAFNELILPSGRAIQEAINSGNRNFNDFITVLDNSKQFKVWLSQVDNDKNLLKEYYEAATKDSWIDKLPSKTFRWSIFTLLGAGIDTLGGGGIGTAAALSIGATDTFLFDKVVKGWKPNMFVNSQLKPFIPNKN